MKKFILKRITDKIVASFYYRKIRRNLPQYNISIIGHDCLAGVSYHQMGKRFDSPFINTLIYMTDYLKLVSNFNEYIDCELCELQNNTEDYPIGVLKPVNLDPIRINFVHDKNFSDCKKKWDERKSRIDFNKLVFYFNLTNVQDEKEVIEKAELFNKLDVPNKLIFIKQKSNIKNSIYINLDGKKIVNGLVTLHKNPKKYWARNCDDMDYINYFKFFM